MTLRVAAVAWKLREIRSDSEFFAHFYDLVNEAHENGAQVVVLPEFTVLELLHLEPNLKEKDVPRYLCQYASTLEEWIVRISSNSGLTLVGGSYFKEMEDGGIANVCGIGDPELGLVAVAKNNLTTYEREVWNLEPGTMLTRAHDPRIGVTICYDVEFPESGRSLAEEGVLVQCVPAFTETQYGHQRVRFCAHARAIENQNFVIHSALVGSLGREPVPETYGSSAIITPSLPQFPMSCVYGETPLNEEGMVFADLDFDLLEQARQTGDVRNWNDRHNSDWLLGRSV